MKFFIASPWRNKDAVKSLTDELALRGHAARSFLASGANLATGTSVTSVMSVANWEDDPFIERIFASEMEALKDSDAVILLEPAGRSSLAEAAIAYGLGKMLILVGTVEHPEVVYHIFGSRYPSTEAFRRPRQQRLEPIHTTLMKRITTGVWLVPPLLMGVFVLSPIVRAAPLTYSTTTVISLTSPSTTLFIAAGSVADAFQVNATSVMVTLSSSTGGGFTLTSTASDLSIASSSGGGAVSANCTSGLASAALSQTSGSTAYTITPTGSPCVVSQQAPTPTPPTVGVASAYGAPNYWASPATAPLSAGSQPSSTQAGNATATTSSSNQLKALQSQLAMLLAKANASASSSSSRFVFSRDLRFGMAGSDVRQLQLFLISQAAGPAAQKLAVHSTTQNFAKLTLNALIEFQKKAGITPAVGYFGPKTRAYVNAN